VLARAHGVLVRVMLSLYLYHGDNFKIECPSGSGKSIGRIGAAFVHELTRLKKGEDRKFSHGGHGDHGGFPSGS
jgi:hypothetical protein